MKTTVLPIDPAHPQVGMLAPQLAARIEKYASVCQPEVDPKEYVRVILSRLWLNDPGLIALGILGEDMATLVGHVLAFVESYGSRAWVYIAQIRADGNVGNARLDAVNAVQVWAKAQGISNIILATNQDGKEFEKKGFKRYRTVMQLSVPSGPPVAAPSEGAPGKA